MRIKLTMFLIFCSLQVFGQLDIETPEIKISFVNADSTYFKVDSLSEDTIKVEILDYEGLEGQGFKITPNPSSIQVQYELGFIQYTIDDIPAGGLNFSKKSKWIDLKETVLPDFYGGNKDVKEVSFHLGYNSRFDLEKVLFEENFDLIHTESINAQSGVFRRVLNDPKMEICCQEYIEQAQRFFKSDPSDLDTIEELGISFYYKSTLMKLQYETEGNTSEASSDPNRIKIPLSSDKAETLSSMTKMLSSKTRMISSMTKMLCSKAKILSSSTKMLITRAKVLSSVTKMLSSGAKMLSSRVKMLSSKAKILPCTTKMLISRAKEPSSMTKMLSSRAKMLSSKSYTSLNAPRLKPKV